MIRAGFSISRVKRLFCGVCGAFALWFVASLALAQSNPPLTQRRINEWAAALERARLALTASGRSRQPGESLTRYLDRIAAPLPGEENRVYRRRWGGLFQALERAATETGAMRTPPALRDASASNIALWQGVSGRVALLPKRLAKTKATWQTLQQTEAPAERARFVAELLQTIALIDRLKNDLRDARP